MPSFVVYSVFYNIFISEIEEITQLIEQKDFAAAFHKTLNIRDKLIYPGWTPFPDYQTAVEKLALKNQLNTLALYLLRSSRNEATDDMDPNAMLRDLTADAHLLNFLEISCNKKSKIKNAVATVSKVTKGYDITKADRLAYDCNANFIWTKPKAVPIPDELNEYKQLMLLFNSMPDENLRAFATEIFANLEPINYQVYDHLDLYQHNIFDPTYRRQQLAIDASNNYKTEHRAFLKMMQEQQEQQDETENAANGFSCSQ